MHRAVGKTRHRSNPQGMESQLHLLLLEDDQQLRTALESLLVDEGYEVATAADGREAVAQAAKQAPDILLLDVKLPGPDGLEVLKQLKQQLPELQSLVMQKMLKGLRVRKKKLIKKRTQKKVSLKKNNLQLKNLIK